MSRRAATRPTKSRDRSGVPPACLVAAKTGGSRTHELYLESALLTEFLRESPQTKGRFPDPLDDVGSIPRSTLKNGNLVPIEKALKSSIDWSIDDLEKAFTQYCVNR